MRNKRKESGVKKKKYVIARAYGAGVFAGTLEDRKGQEVVLSKLVGSGTGRVRPRCLSWPRKA